MCAQKQLCSPKSPETPVIFPLTKSYIYPRFRRIFHCGHWFLTYHLPLNGDSRAVDVMSNRILMKATMRTGTYSFFNDKAKVTVAIQAVIIIVIICSGIAGAGRGP